MVWMYSTFWNSAAGTDRDSFMVVSRLMLFLRLLLYCVWIDSDSGWRCEVRGCIGIREDGDGEVDRYDLLSDTLLNAVRARCARLWYSCPVFVIVSHGRGWFCSFHATDMS